MAAKGMFWYSSPCYGIQFQALTLAYLPGTWKILLHVINCFRTVGKLPSSAVSQVFLSTFTKPPKEDGQGSTRYIFTTECLHGENTGKEGQLIPKDNNFGIYTTAIPYIQILCGTELSECKVQKSQDTVKSTHSFPATARSQSLLSESPTKYYLSLSWLHLGNSDVVNVMHTSFLRLRCPKHYN